MKHKKHTQTVVLQIFSLHLFIIYSTFVFFLSAILIRICMQIQMQMGLSPILSGRAFSVSSIWTLSTGMEQSHD